MTRGGADTELGEVNMGGLATGETDYWFDNDGEASRRYVIERPLFISDDWRDHDEDDIYADWTVDLGTGAINVNRRYMEGVSFADVPLPQDGPAYFHGDHLGTTRRLSQAGGSPPARASIYTAFGELKYTAGSLTTRYGYVGASGYEESAAGGPPDLEFVHVGARWYDPSTGRFLQRDPIGISGGLNVYAYAQNNPLASVDPDGLIRIGPHEATGPSDEAMYDWFWTKVHYCAGYDAAMIGWSLGDLLRDAIRYEIWEKKNWWGFDESPWNQAGDVIAAVAGWTDAVFLEPATPIINKMSNWFKRPKTKPP